MSKGKIISYEGLIPEIEIDDDVIQQIIQLSKSYSSFFSFLVGTNFHNSNSEAPLIHVTKLESTITNLDSNNGVIEPPPIGLNDVTIFLDFMTEKEMNRDNREVLINSFQAAMNNSVSFNCNDFYQILCHGYMKPDLTLEFEMITPTTKFLLRPLGRNRTAVKPSSEITYSVSQHRNTTNAIIIGLNDINDPRLYGLCYSMFVSVQGQFLVTIGTVFYQFSVQSESDYISLNSVVHTSGKGFRIKIGESIDGAPVKESSEDESINVLQGEVENLRKEVNEIKALIANEHKILIEEIRKSIREEIINYTQSSISSKHVDTPIIIQKDEDSYHSSSESIPVQHSKAVREQVDDSISFKRTTSSIKPNEPSRQQNTFSSENTLVIESDATLDNFAKNYLNL